MVNEITGNWRLRYTPGLKEIPPKNP